MEEQTAELWAKQNKHEGDRERLFTVVARTIEADSVLYPGSYVDIAASFGFDNVTYVDIDKRAKRFFSDDAGIREILGPGSKNRRFNFIHADYSSDLGLEYESFDLLISLYAGFISEHCTRYLRVGGHLLVNPSHGDASMASIDDRYDFVGVVQARGGTYRILVDDELEEFLIPKVAQKVTVKLLHELGRGIPYTKSPFAYLFQRVR